MSANDPKRALKLQNDTFRNMLYNARATNEPGKRANITILSNNPLATDPLEIKDIEVRGTIMEGRKLPAGKAKKKAALDPRSRGEPADSNFAETALNHALKVVHTHL